jgi:hypothetical protein
MVAVVVALRRRDGVAGAGRVGVAVTELAGAGACDSVPLLVRHSGAAVLDALACAAELDAVLSAAVAAREAPDTSGWFATCRRPRLP